MIRCWDGDEAGIPKFDGDGDDIQFLIPVDYGYGNKEGHMCLHPTTLLDRVNRVT
ncbi:hypothetical protein MTR_1g094950 [Medicago truncatula]|uniref:Uncharacterized protein n=1 Tax=Medicago truncatula TaxID=3880 RepID=G7I381_MEDTR|nr:hypothetical protein MTR_1g094950 [Medicago truncatula]